MADSIRLQPWVSLSGASSAIVVLQHEVGYADLCGHSSLVVYAEVSDLSGGPYLTYQTSPTRDEGLWANMASALSPSLGLNTTILRYDDAAVPPARWVRWRASGESSSWRITFRIWLSCTQGSASDVEVEDLDARRSMRLVEEGANWGPSRIPTGRRGVVIGEGGFVRRVR